MKKLVLFVAVGAFALTMASCKKDYTCTCTVGDETTTFDIKDAKKKDAEAACDTWGVFATAAGGTCSI